MIDHAFFMLIASLGVTLAGFAALLHGLVRSSPTKLGRWRIRNIVELGFRAAVLSLGVLAIDAFAGDEKLVIQMASGLFLVSLARPWYLLTLRDSDIYRNRGELLATVVSLILQAGLAMFNVFRASYGLLLVLYIILVVNPASIFLAFVAEQYRPDTEQSWGNGHHLGPACGNVPRGVAGRSGAPRHCC